MYATTLEKKITRYLKGFGIKRARVNDYFCYQPSNQTITFSMFNYPEDELLIEFIRNKYDIDISLCYFVFALLHEVGHHVTLPLVSIEDYTNDGLMRQLVNASDQKDEFYFSLPTEVLATEWALAYLTQHFEECWNFQSKCLKIIQHIYKKKSFPANK